MKQAKQQSQDLRQTDDFLHSVISQDNSEKEKSNSKDNSSRQMNGKPKLSRIDPISRFSDPPAPPPQQPLPEKPDAARRLSQEPHSLKRSDTEKPAKTGSANSPVSRESSQILSLIEALSSAKKELDAQGARVKELEDLLRRERSARESAEERARKLEGQRSEVEAAFEPPADQADKDVSEEPKVEQVSELDAVKEPVETAQSHVKEGETSLLESHGQQLQQRLDSMVTELAEMKQQVENFKQRAEKAEGETVEARKSLSEMIENLRREREAAQHAGTKTTDGVSEVAKSREFSPSEKEAAASLEAVVQSSRHGINSAKLQELENAATAFATQRRRHNLLEQSTPYASMLGVVLLGVGIMAYLNGWQKLDK
jgi:hypothetical protein